MAVTLAQDRWLFLSLSVLSLVAGFYFNVFHSSTRLARITFWISTIFSVATLVHWGWWRP